MGLNFSPSWSQGDDLRQPAMVKRLQQTLLRLGLASNLRRAPAILAWKTTGRDDQGHAGPQPCPWACPAAFLVAVAAVSLFLGLSWP